MNFYNRVFSYNFRYLRILGLWTANQRSEINAWLYCCYQAFVLFLFFTGSLSACIDFYLNLHDIRKLVMNFCMLLPLLAGFFKSCWFLLHVNEINALRRDLDRDLPKESEENRKILIATAKEMEIILKFNIFAVLFLSSSMLILPLLNPEARGLPMPIWMPFDLYSGSTYYIVYLYEIILCYYYAATIMLTNTGTIAFIIRISAEYNIFNVEIREYCRRYVTEFDDATAKAEMRKLICRHQKIIGFIDRFHVIYGKPLLVQVVGSVSLFLALELDITLLSTSLNIRLMFQLWYMAVAIEDLFFYCYAGSKLIEQGKNIAKTIFASEWFVMPPDYRRCFAFIILRSQRHPKIIVGKMLIVDFNLLLDVFKLTYNLLAVLTQLTAKS